MKIDLFNVEEFVKINNLQEIKSPVIFSKGDIPHPEGLLSNEIFGVTTKSRKNTFAYIDLGGYFFNPHIYKAIRRMYRNIDRIVNGELYVSLDAQGRIVEDQENGYTGIKYLYDNWSKINWTKNDEDKDAHGMRQERESLLKDFKRNEIFMKYQIVIPVFYRDIKSGSRGNSTDDINQLYTKLIRYASLIKGDNLFDFQFDATNYNIQNTIVAVYDYFKQRLEKKNGLIRRYLMGKSVDNCTRTVITAPTFHSNRPEDAFVSYYYSSLPLAQVCSLTYPFIMHYIKNFFEREVMDNKYAKIMVNKDTTEISKTIELDNPESYFSDKYIKNMIDSFIKDPESRFNKIEIPVKAKDKEPGKKAYLVFTGKRMDDSNTAELAPTRPMTVCDLLYLAAVDVTKNKHCEITRYPLNDEFGIFFTRIRVASTSKTVPMLVNGQLYKWYPYVELDLRPDMIGSRFIDATQFSNSYLEGIEGDYDGDQTTVKIIWTQEANEEIEKVITKKTNFINAPGNNIRVVSKEVLQTFYVLTKDPYGSYKSLTKEEKDYFLHLDPKKITLTDMISWFGNTTTIKDSKEGKDPSKSKFNPCDTLTISSKEYSIIKSDKPIRTTIGRLIFNKLMVEGLGFGDIIGYCNDVLKAGVFKSKFDRTVGNALKDDKITTEQMVKYINMRDWFGLSLHGVITTSFTPGVLTLPPKVEKLKKKLMEENKEALANGDEVVMEKIEKQLIAATQEALKDDIGMDLYNSGARGSVDNHLKNIMISRGAILNPATGKYEIIENSLMDGLAKKDIPTHANVIVSGAYPKAVGTQVSGYMSKELLAAFQTETLADKDSDCGSKRTITVTLTEGNYDDFIYRYIKEGSKLIMLDNENKSKYLGKTVQMRSPMYCLGIGKDRCICNKCAGDFYYKLGKKDIGLLSSKVATTLTQLGLQKFHQNLVKTKQIDPKRILL
jgi:DNA-directed RNA polymerase beta' subunit